MEQKKRFIVSVTYYALFALLIYGGVKYALPVLIPFLLASGVIILLRRPARELAGRAPGSERLWTFLLLAAFYLLLFGFVLLAGVRFVSGAGTFFQNLPELYRTTLLPALGRFFDWVGERMAQFDPALVSAVESFFAEMSLSLNQTVSTVFSVAFGQTCGHSISSDGSRLWHESENGGPNFRQVLSRGTPPMPPRDLAWACPW